MKRILPKILMVGLLAGVASFLLGIIAKLLIAVSVLGLIVLFAKNRISRHLQMRYQPPAFGQADSRYFAYNQPQQPFYHSHGFVPVQQGGQVQPGIVPIN